MENGPQVQLLECWLTHGLQSIFVKVITYHIKQSNAPDQVRRLTQVNEAAPQHNNSAQETVSHAVERLSLAIARPKLPTCNVVHRQNIRRWVLEDANLLIVASQDLSTSDNSKLLAQGACCLSTLLKDLHSSASFKFNLGVALGSVLAHRDVSRVIESEDGAQALIMLSSPLVGVLRAILMDKKINPNDILPSIAPICKLSQHDAIAKGFVSDGIVQVLLYGIVHVSCRVRAACATTLSALPLSEAHSNITVMKCFALIGEEDLQCQIAGLGTLSVVLKSYDAACQTFVAHDGWERPIITGLDLSINSALRRNAVGVLHGLCKSHSTIQATRVLGPCFIPLLWKLVSCSYELNDTQAAAGFCLVHLNGKDLTPQQATLVAHLLIHDWSKIRSVAVRMVKQIRTNSACINFVEPSGIGNLVLLLTLPDHHSEKQEIAWALQHIATFPPAALFLEIECNSVDGYKAFSSLLYFDETSFPAIIVLESVMVIQKSELKELGDLVRAKRAELDHFGQIEIERGMNEFIDSMEEFHLSIEDAIRLLHGLNISSVRCQFSERNGSIAFTAFRDLVISVQ